MKQLNINGIPINKPPLIKPPPLFPNRFPWPLHFRDLGAFIKPPLFRNRYETRGGLIIGIPLIDHYKSLPCTAGGAEGFCTQRNRKNSWIVCCFWSTQFGIFSHLPSFGSGRVRFLKKYPLAQRNRFG